MVQFVSLINIDTADVSAMVSIYNDSISNVNDAISGFSATGSVTFLSGTGNVLGSLTVAGALSVTGTLTFTTASTGVFVARDSANVSGTLSVGSAAYFSAEIGAAGSAHISGSLQVAGSALISGALRVSGPQQWASALSAAGAANQHRMSGTLALGGLYVSNNNGTATLKNSTAVCGLLQASQLHVSGAASFAGVARFGGVVSFEAFVNFSGGMHVCGTTTMACGLIVCNTVLDVEVSATFRSNVSLAGRLYLANALVAASGQMTSAATVFLFDTSAAGGAIGWRLCAASDSTLQTIIVKRIDSAANTMRLLVCGGADLIDGSAAVDLASRGGLLLYSDGVEWFAPASAAFA